MHTIGLSVSNSEGPAISGENVHIGHQVGLLKTDAVQDAIFNSAYFASIATRYLLISTDKPPHKQAKEELLKAATLRSAIFNSTNFLNIATDAKGVIQIINAGAERMLGYTALEVMNKITLADISDLHEVIARAEMLSLKLDTPIMPGFEALVFMASGGIEEIYNLNYVRKDGSHFPALVSVTTLRNATNAIIGYHLFGTDDTAPKRIETAQNGSTSARAAECEAESRRCRRTDTDPELQKKMGAGSTSTPHFLIAGWAV
jgi:PAS domain-containing protein